MPGRHGTPVAPTTHAIAAPARPFASPKPTTPSVLAWGAAATVQGGNGAPRKVTPIAAWWLTSDGTGSDATRPSLGRFLIVELKLSAAGSPATFPVPLTGDGPMVVSGGRMVSDAGDSASDDVV